MEVLPAEWKEIPFGTKALALAAIPLILGGVVSTAHFSASAARTHSPDLIAQNTAGEVLLGSRDTLLLVTADGRVSTIELNALSLEREESGRAGKIMSVSSDGTSWYVGEDREGMLHQCDLSKRTCRPVLQTDSGRRVLRGAHDVAITADRIYVTDSAAHRLLVFDREGHRLTATRTAPVELCFPNGIVAVDGDLYVADTNNLRIARIDGSDPSRSETFLHVGAGVPVQRANCTNRSARLRERGNALTNTAIDSATTKSQVARPPARRDREWPVSILHTSQGDWWVIQQKNGMRSGDLIIYGESGEAKLRVPLPENSDPVDMIETPTGVLVTDSSAFAVHRISLSGEVLGAWEAVSAQLDALKQRHDRALFAQRGSQAAIGLGALAALFVVILELRRERRSGRHKKPPLRPDYPPAPLVGDIHWIGVETRFLKRAKLGQWLPFGFAAVYGLANYWILLTIDSEKPLHRVMFWVSVVVTMILVVVGIATVLYVQRLARRRIGVSEQEVFFDPGTGEIQRFSQADVRVGPMSLLLGTRIIQTVDGFKRPVYSQEDIGRYLLARLPPQVFLEKYHLFLLEALRRGSPAMWLSVIGLTLGVSIVIADELNPEWLRFALESLVIQWLSSMK